MTKITSKTRILAAFDPDKSAIEIAEETGAPCPTVRAVLSQHGLFARTQVRDGAATDMRQKGAWPPGMRFQDAEGVR